MTVQEQLNNNLQLPVVAAPMFLISSPSMVVECCKNGVVGTFPALNQRTSEGFEEWLQEIQKELAAFEAETGKKAAPYGVNLIVHRTNPRVQADLELCVKYKVPIIITSLGAVPDLVEAVHSYGGMVFHDVTNLRHAQKAAQAKVDGIIAVAGGAGGHAGTTNPFALIAEIRSFFEGTILLAGCMNSGSDIAAALSMGANYAYMGTRFINTKESRAVDEYKQMIVDCGVKDVVYTPAVSGVPASFMKPSLEKAGFDMEALLNPGGVDFGSKLKPAEDEAKAWKTVWSAGQGCVGINDVPSIEELVNRLKTEFATTLTKQQNWLQKYS